MKNYFKKILKLFTTTEVSMETKNEFYLWLIEKKHASEKEDALRELWKNLHKKKFSSNLEHSYERLKKRANIPSIPKRRKMHPNVIWQSVAIIAILFSVFVAIQDRIEIDLIEKYIPTAQTEVMILPDGTRVILNSESTLIYPEKFRGKTRSVYLIGEGNFRVAHNPKKPFIVKANDFQITALGTEFNVSAYPKDRTLTATLISGTVRVDYNNLQSNVILCPNEQIIYNKQSHTSEVVYPDLQEVTAWQKGELVLRDMSLIDVITVLERKFPYTFVYSLCNLKTDKYTFRFKENASFSEIMDIIIKVVENTSYNIIDDKCYLVSNK